MANRKPSSGKTMQGKSAAGSAPGPIDMPELDFPPSEFVQSLQRGLAVLLSFDEAHPARTLSDVAQEVGLTRAAARRFLLTLQALGYVESDGKLFRLRPKTLQLGHAYLVTQPWWRHAQRVAEKLGAELHQACGIGVFDRDAVTYVAYAPAIHLPSLSRVIGTRLPIHATAIGRVLLAGLPDVELETILQRISLEPLTPLTVTSADRLRRKIAEVKNAGYSIVNEELEIGLRAISVPMLDRSGRVTAAISISIRDPFMKPEDLVPKFLAAMRQASQDISAALPQ
jgi:IclR family pca regulon transcriptional regulator